MNNYIDLIYSNNPDKDYEIWWYSYKNLITKYLNPFELKEIQVLSSNLNSYKEKKEYDIILYNIYKYYSKYIYNYNNTYLDRILKSGNYFDIQLLYKKNNRFNSIVSNKYHYNNNNIFIILLNILNKAIYNHKKNPKYINIIDIITKSQIITNEHIHKILYIALDNNLHLIITLLKSIDNFEDLLIDWIHYFKNKPYLPSKYPARKLTLFWRDYNNNIDLYT